MDNSLPDLKRSSRVLAARDLCLEPGRTAWEEAWILLSICRDGSTPAEKKRPKPVEDNLYQESNKTFIFLYCPKAEILISEIGAHTIFAECVMDKEQRCWIFLDQIKYPQA